MKNKFLPLFALGLWGTFSVGAQGIQFHKNTWAEIKAKAKAENKYIFVDTYTAWCGPCKWQSKKVFPQKKVGDFFNKNFVSLKLNAEKGEGVGFAKEYKVSTFPTLLYFDPQGKIVHRTRGAFPAKKLLQQAKRAMNPETQLYPLKRRFEKGERSKHLLKNYVVALTDVLEDFNKPAEMYLNQIGKNNWTTAEGWEFINVYMRKSSDKVFEYVMKNQHKFAKAVGGQEKVDKYINGVLKEDMERVARSKDKSQLNTFKRRLREVFGKEANKYIAKAEYTFYANDKEKTLQYAREYFDNYCDSALEFDRAAWQYFLKYDDRQKLEEALRWAEKSVKMDKGFVNKGTQAHLLFKLKLYKKAKEVIEEAIVLANKAKDRAWADYFTPFFKKLHKKIEAKL